MSIRRMRNETPVRELSRSHAKRDEEDRPQGGS